MKIGLLAYHSAINFGATLQLLSTYRYLMNHGHQPIIINWVAADLDAYYESSTTEAQRNQQLQIRQQIWKETTLCRTSKEVAEVIQKEGIEAVIIGSDAVARHNSLMERLTFPCRTIIGIKGTHSDWTFPNAFWADWEDYLEEKIPVAVISASCQDSAYRYFMGSLRREMEKRVMAYDYLSVRDTWTQKMMSHITQKKRIPEVTPDPVFAFSQNAASSLPTREEILKRFNLPEKYILLSFINSRTVSQQWIDEFAELARKDGKTCVMLPFAHAASFGKSEKTIQLPLSPIDWYALILNSEGYVGHNMHPIVVSLHNNVPFFSFDNYGTKRFNGLLPDESSSKILHILKLAELEDQRVSCISKTFTPPSPQEVYAKLYSFDREKARTFATQYLAKYNAMMETVLKTLER